MPTPTLIDTNAYFLRKNEADHNIEPWQLMKLRLDHVETFHSVAEKIRGERDSRSVVTMKSGLKLMVLEDHRVLLRAIEAIGAPVLDLWQFDPGYEQDELAAVAAE